MQGLKPFNEWAFEILSKNIFIQDTPSHLTDTNLRYHLEARMHPDLADEYYAEKITETDLRKWIEKVGLLDDKRLYDIAKYKEAVEAVLRAERRKITTSEKPTSSARSNAKAGQKMSTTSISSCSRPFICLPLLTDDDRQLLHDNEGCFKCCDPFVQHLLNNCPKGFPDGATYKPLTAAFIATKKTKKGPSTVAAIEIGGVYTVAVEMLSAVLGDGSDSSEECMALFTTPHLT
jgi:hypothetical protein